jgi:hypothetical protein
MTTRTVLLLQSIFVGLYSLVIHWGLSGIVIHAPEYVIMFILGCFKHAFGYFIGLHAYFCKCSRNKKMTMPTAFENVGEGVLFVVMNELLWFIQNIHLKVFWIGVLIHLIAEFIGFHKWFCRTHCL